MTGENLTAANIQNLGQPVFLSANAVSDTKTVEQIVNFWASIHAPTYGVPIPGTGKTVNGAGGSILAPGTNETAYVNGLSVHNANATDVATATIYLQNAQFASVDIPPQSGVALIGVGAETASPFYLANGQALTVVMSGTGAADASFICSYSLAVQG